MFYLKKRVSISAAHHLIGYDGPCANQHGHNWIINVYCKGKDLNKIGMLVDFAEIKRIVNEYDHTDINEHDDFKDKLNTSAENIAKVLCEKIPGCYKVSVEETDGSEVTYIPE